MTQCGVPIEVYLDSSDYSALSDPARLRADAALARTREDFLRWTASGRAHFRSSGVTLLEILQLKKEAKVKAAERAALINTLGRGRVLRFPFEVVALEGSAYCRTGRPLTERSVVYRDDGQWIALDGLAPDMGQLVTQGLHEELRQTDMSRQQRRALIRRLHKGGSAKNEMKQFLNRQTALNPSTADLPPVTQRFHREQMMLRAVRGDVSAQELGKEFAKGMRNPQNIVEYLDRLESAAPIIEFLRDLNERLYTGAREICERARPLYFQALKAGADEKALRAQFNRQLQTTRDSFRLRMLDAVYDGWVKGEPGADITKAVWFERLGPSALGSLPALDCLVEAYVVYLRRLLLDERREPQKSDASDLLHCMYIPYVDIFRADGDFAQNVMAVAKVRGYMVASKLKALHAMLLERVGTP